MCRPDAKISKSRAGVTQTHRSSIGSSRNRMSTRAGDRRAEHARPGVLTQEVLELRHTDEIDIKASLGESGHHRTLLG